MKILVTVFLLLGLSLLLVLALVSVLRDLLERNPQAGPVFDDPGPMVQDRGDEHGQARSQFAWQSRSHFRAPD
jgi:hypothetical protein